MAEIWLQATDRANISLAANGIDQALGVEPLSQGEEFYGDRILVVLSLAVTYTVSESDLSVQILQVWHRFATGENIE